MSRLRNSQSLDWWRASRHYLGYEVHIRHRAQNNRSVNPMAYTRLSIATPSN